MKKLIYGLILFVAYAAFGALSEPDRALIPPRNLLVNPGFELGTAKWTASGGTLSTTSTTSAVGSGTRAGTWDSSASSQTLKTGLAIPAGLYGKAGVASCNIRVPSGTATHTLAATDTTNILSSQTITSTANYVRTSVNFIFPTSGSIELRLTSVASNEPLIDIDDCYLGDAQGFNLAQDNAQSYFVGEAHIVGSSCTWVDTGNSWAIPSPNSSCPAPVVDSNPGPGVIQTTATHLPQIIVNNLPPGDYEVTASFVGPMGSNGGYAIGDGTTISGITGRDSPTSNGLIVLIGHFSYSNAGNRTFSVNLENTSTGSTEIRADGLTGDNAWRLVFTVKKIGGGPAQQVFTPDKLANSWSGYHDKNCAWSSTSTSYADPSATATCTFTEKTNVNFGTVTSAKSGGNYLPGIVFTPSRAGKYYVCASGIAWGDASTRVLSTRLWDGTTVISDRYHIEPLNTAADEANVMCGVYNAASTSPVTLSVQLRTSAGTINLYGENVSPTIEWSIFQIDQALPAPFVVNSEVNNSSGVMKHVYAQMEVNGSSSSIIRQTGSVFAFSTTGANNSQITWTLTAGTFSQVPYCQLTPYYTVAGGTVYSCDIFGTTTSTQIKTECQDVNGNPAFGAGFGFNIDCAGAP